MAPCTGWTGHEPDVEKACALPAAQPFPTIPAGLARGAVVRRAVEAHRPGGPLQQVTAEMTQC
jgi:hypothetical protein